MTYNGDTLLGKTSNVFEIVGNHGMLGIGDFIEPTQYHLQCVSEISGPVALEKKTKSIR